MAAYAIDAAGRRELLDYRQAASESTAEWGRLLGSLVGRGLDPDELRLVVADGAGGIREAVAEAFPDVPFGRCWTHRLRNLLEALPLCERRVCLRGLRAMYRAIGLHEVWHRRGSGEPSCRTPPHRGAPIYPARV